MRVAVLASGRGSNLHALIEAQRRGQLAIEIVGVFSDKPDCGAIALAEEFGLANDAIPPNRFRSREDFDAVLFGAIAAVQPDLIVCAGYMRIISEAAVRRFEGRMINIHPSLLPKYPGLNTHARALAAGDVEHGASVHLVIPALDAGPVLSQVRVAVLADDTSESLARRVLAREHVLLVQSVGCLAERRVTIDGTEFRRGGQPLPAPLLLNDQDQLEECH